MAAKAAIGGGRGGLRILKGAVFPAEFFKITP